MLSLTHPSNTHLRSVVMMRLSFIVKAHLDLGGNSGVDADHNLAALQRSDLWHGHRADRWDGCPIHQRACRLCVVGACTPISNGQSDLHSGHHILLLNSALWAPHYHIGAEI